MLGCLPCLKAIYLNFRLCRLSVPERLVRILPKSGLPKSQKLIFVYIFEWNLRKILNFRCENELWMLISSLWLWNCSKYAKNQRLWLCSETLAVILFVYYSEVNVKKWIDNRRIHNKTTYNWIKWDEDSITVAPAWNLMNFLAKLLYNLYQ